MLTVEALLRYTHAADTASLLDRLDQNGMMIPVKDRAALTSRPLAVQALALTRCVELSFRPTRELLAALDHVASVPNPVRGRTVPEVCRRIGSANAMHLSDKIRLG